FQSVRGSCAGVHRKRGRTRIARPSPMRAHPAPPAFNAAVSLGPMVTRDALVPAALVVDHRPLHSPAASAMPTQQSQVITDEKVRGPVLDVLIRPPAAPGDSRARARSGARSSWRPRPKQTR